MFKTVDKIPTWNMKKGSSAKNIIAVVSGKGGVGKSSVSSLLSTHLNKKGFKVGLLDADITGPSIPKLFGFDSKMASVENESIKPIKTRDGIYIMSMNLILPDDSEAVIWRSPIILSAIKEFYEMVMWPTLDYLIIDLPPGTGDIPLSIMQSANLNGIVLVTTPQELVQLIVKKSENMAEKMNIPILGVVENMSYFICPDTNKKYFIFGESGIDNQMLEVLGKIPIDMELRKLSDSGNIEKYDTNRLFKENIEDILK